MAVNPCVYPGPEDDLVASGLEGEEEEVAPPAAGDQRGGACQESGSGQLPDLVRANDEPREDFRRCWRKPEAPSIREQPVPCAVEQTPTSCRGGYWTMQLQAPVLALF
jgi:hypothetical protein